MHSKRLLPRWSWWAGWALLGLLLGLSAAWYGVRPQNHFGQTSGAWRVSLLAGSAQAGALTRAQVAVGGLLALNRAETLYYVAGQDSQGRALRSRCRYRIAGVLPAARWWSITAYAEDHFLFPDASGRYSVNNANVWRDGKGGFVVHTGPEAPLGERGPFIATPGDRGLVLTLRLYNPSASLQSAPQTLVVPTIEALGDCA